MKEPPCKDCPAKGCGAYHDICPQYQAVVDYNRRIYTEMRQAKHMDNACYTKHHLEAIRKKSVRHATGSSKYSN